MTHPTPPRDMPRNGSPREVELVPRPRTDEPLRDGSPREERTVRAMAREAIQTGRLPKGNPRGTWGGPGRRALCALCETPVGPEELELEVEFAPANGGSVPERHHLHPRCFAAWEFERRKPEVIALPETAHLATMRDGGFRTTTEGESA